MVLGVRCDQPIPPQSDYKRWMSPTAGTVAQSDTYGIPDSPRTGLKATRTV